MPEARKTRDQGFILKTKMCPRNIAGIVLNNAPIYDHWPTKRFKVQGSQDLAGPWEDLVEEELEDSRLKNPPPFITFYFGQQTKVQFIWFHILSIWSRGGGLQYFAPLTDCEDILQPEIVWGTMLKGYTYYTKNVLTLEEESFTKKNYWLADNGKEDQGFTMKVSSCRKAIAGVLIKNTRHSNRATKSFRVTGQVRSAGPWEVLVENGFMQTPFHNRNREVQTFYFPKPVAVKYLRFELLEYWGSRGGGLQYFHPLPIDDMCATGKWSN